MDDSFYDGHDELYKHAKFGEDRITRAGCRCENVVFVCYPRRARSALGVDIVLTLDVCLYVCMLPL